MAKKKEPAKTGVRLSKSEIESFDRFGCVFREKNGIVYIDWRGKNIVLSEKAKIYARLVRFATDTGPLVLLACEISPVRPLPRYSYVSFDLQREAHKEWLTQLITAGEIRFCFVSDDATFERTHLLKPRIQSLASQAYADALEDWSHCQARAYDPGEALALFERLIRLPFLFQRLLEEDTTSDLTQKIKEAVLEAPPENRELATRIVGEATEVLGPFYQVNERALVETIRSVRIYLGIALDLYEVLGDSNVNFSDFLTEALAGAYSREQLENVERGATVLTGLFRLLFRNDVGSQPSIPIESPAPSMPQVPATFVDLIQSMVASGITKDLASQFLEFLGLEVGGKRGRPPIDYAREYKHRLSGASWTEVTRQALQQNSALREEFGGRDFDSLDFKQQESLKHRIRVGVTSFAQREGKPLPPRLQSSPTGHEDEEKS